MGRAHLPAARSAITSQNPQALLQPVPRSQPIQSSSTFIRKVPGGQVEIIELSDSDDSDSVAPPPKRPRLEPLVKQPLGAKNRNTPKSVSVHPLPQWKPLPFAATNPSICSPAKSKENSYTSPASSQAALLKPQARGEDVITNLPHYQTETSYGKHYVKVNASGLIERTTFNLYTPRAEVETVDLRQLSNNHVPVTGPSSLPTQAHPLPSSQAFPPHLTWKSYSGGLTPVLGQGDANLVDDDDSSGDDSSGDDSPQFPHWTQLQPPIMSQRIKTTVNE